MRDQIRSAPFCILRGCALDRHWLPAGSELEGDTGMDHILSDLAPFLDGDGRLSAFPAKHKKKRMALWYLAGKIEAGREYTEPEINALLDEWTLFHDPATLRRELYNARLLDRTADCSSYQKAGEIPALEKFVNASG